MAFIETRLVECVSYAFQGGPNWNTRVVVLQNGQEKRNINWTRPRHRYSAPYDNRTRTEHATLLSAYNACRGQAHGFRFKDWMDYEGLSESIGTAPGSGSDPVQLVKAYTFGATSYSRTISKPVAGTVTVYEGGSPVAGTTDTTTGEFTPSGSWSGGALTADFQFDVPVRFNADYFPATYAELNAISSEIEIVELFL